MISQCASALSEEFNVSVCSYILKESHSTEVNIQSGWLSKFRWLSVRHIICDCLDWAVIHLSCVHSHFPKCEDLLNIKASEAVFKCTHTKKGLFAYVLSLQHGVCNSNVTDTHQSKSSGDAWSHVWLVSLLVIDSTLTSQIKVGCQKINFGRELCSAEKLDQELWFITSPVKENLHPYIWWQFFSFCFYNVILSNVSHMCSY